MESISQILTTLSHFMSDLNGHEYPIIEGTAAVALFFAKDIFQLVTRQDKTPPIEEHQSILLDCVFANRNNSNFRLRFVQNQPMVSRSRMVFESRGYLKILNAENEEMDSLHVSCTIDMKRKTGNLTDTGDLISNKQPDPDIHALRNAFMKFGIQLYDLQCNSDRRIREGSWRLKDGNYSGTFKIN